MTRTCDVCGSDDVVVTETTKRFRIAIGQWSFEINRINRELCGECHMETIGPEQTLEMNSTAEEL